MLMMIIENHFNLNGTACLELYELSLELEQILFFLTNMTCQLQSS